MDFLLLTVKYSLLLVAVFFQILSGNQGSEFRLIYDDLPVYYVPAIHKERLFILANLFTK